MYAGDMDERYEYEDIADWLGEMPEAKNHWHGNDEQTTVIEIDVEVLAERISGREWKRKAKRLDCHWDKCRRRRELGFAGCVAWCQCRCHYPPR